jgi:hypothetical protein
MELARTYVDELDLARIRITSVSPSVVGRRIAPTIAPQPTA